MTDNSTTFFTDITIESLSDDGKGITHLDGKTTFVENALPGDKVSIRITERHKNFNNALMTELQTPSADRETPFCQYFEKCGGCQLQNLNIDKQREYKLDNFTHHLQQALDTSKCQMQEPIFSGDQAYRRRARLGLAISKIDKQARLGFRQKDSNELIDIQQCPVLTESLNHFIAEHRQSWLEQASRSYKEITLVEAENGVFQYMQQNQKALQDTSTEKPNQKPFYQLEGIDKTLKIEFPVDGFVQVNQDINQQMVKQAIDWLELKPHHKVLDLFSGVGNFTLALAQHCDQITGIEGLSELVDIANENAQNNQLANCHFAKANLFEDNRKAQWFRKQKYDRILMDPGRQGAFEISKHLHLLKADIIVYVSCNFATLIRDIKELQKQGYQIHKAGLMDMFPHTHHTEVMVQLKKGKTKKSPNRKEFRF